MPMSQGEMALLSRPMREGRGTPGDGLDHVWYIITPGVSTIASTHRRTPALTAMQRHPSSTSPGDPSPRRTLRKKEIYADGEEWIGRGS